MKMQLTIFYKLTNHKKKKKQRKERKKLGT